MSFRIHYSPQQFKSKATEKPKSDQDWLIWQNIPHPQNFFN